VPVAIAAIRRSRVRTAFLVAGVTLLAAAIATATSIVATVWMAPPEARATSLEGRQAPDVRLHDYRGVAFSLADVRGRPVVLSFLYTNCPSTCRLTAAGIRQAVDRLGTDGERVALIAVTTDPRGDGPTDVRHFLQRHGLESRMTYLVGDRRALTTLWDFYYIFPGDERSGLDSHTDGLFVLDGDGRERYFLTSDFDSTDLATILRELLI